MLGRIADSLGTASVLITLFFTIWTFWIINRQKKKMLEFIGQNSPKFDDFVDFIKDNRGITSVKPVALLVSLTPNKDSVKPNVKTFFAVENLKMPIKEVKMNGLNSDDEIKTFIETLMQERIKIQAREYTEIHLFINAPMFACVLTGSILKNLMPIKIYHFNSTSAKFYEYKMPLI